jgi:vacuolar-type H+-ATPase subunit F/Vma7
VDFYVVADEDTVTGFAYVGIGGIAVRTPQEAARHIQALAEKEEELVLITTERIAHAIRPTVNRVRFGEQLPLIVEIPGPQGPSEGAPDLLKQIREAIGIRI